VGLLFPAVRAAREPARVSTPKKELEQIGIAMPTSNDPKGGLAPRAP
jgi:hypothetical protein